MAAEKVPPYLRIASEIRRRIEEGELVAGDRVPSTRRIAEEWHVALATATKALHALRQDGLVEARPRAGTVVAPSRRTTGPARGSRAAPPSDHELTRARIVRTAVEIADAEGLAALSMRGVAARLGAATMSPYRYVNGKDELVLLMADSVLGEIAYPAEPPACRRTRLETGARALWVLHRAHPWLAQLAPLTRPLALPNLMAYSEWMLAGLDGLGLEGNAMLDINVLLYSHLQGLAAHLEQEAHAESVTGLSQEQWLAEQEAAFGEIAASGRYPTFARLLESFGADGYDLDLDALFESGLQALLDGLVSPRLR
ncbi:TetR/AcrR family transcriptional regulator C-terminal domain-containing protein [Streptomyces purpurogeneiscleroticus]|uniref:TetR/AcrR family transcriptional regulator C-terminal domain-containing protein n=1 Tax=Streptomyces purpurogeneiscleroticus TaxID=68259 RepID=UPI001CBC0542|nr:TetR/AcrR family transcriptional regulator C-terminal domain-containing protein [Streptomyces purpurogeneiscleroticus]MBZ4017030.1 GntR family transcriptional regulator [Streptomyces purpurogeneiscleroticus]